MSAEIADGFTSRKGLSQAVIAALSEHVSAIDDRLDWEFGPGERAAHHLCLSSKGDPVLRVVVERWRRSAPTEDATWEFYGARRANPRGGLQLDIGDHHLVLDELALGLEEDSAKERIHLVVDHPQFAVMADDDLKLRIAFIALDNTLGEDDVERWIGGVELARGPLSESVTLPQLSARVRAFAARATGDRWALLKGTFDGAPLFVLINTAIKRIDHLVLDTHVQAIITIAHPTSEGLTDNDEAAALNAMEDELQAMLGAEAVHVARETSRGKRTLHFHVMEGGPSAAIFAHWRARHPDYAIELTVEHDPRWQILRRWT